MKTLFSVLRKSRKNRDLVATYNIGILETKAYKAIMGKIACLLDPSKVSNVDWVALGVIYDHPQGIRSSSLAAAMGVEQPFITVVTAKLAKRGFLKVFSDPTDKRAKILHLTKEGKRFVARTEPMLVKEMEKVSAEVSTKDALAYFRVLRAIVDYSEKDR